MRLRVVGVLLFIFALLVYASGVAVDSPSLMVQGALGALGLAAVYVVLAGRGAPAGVRWALLGSLAAVAASVGAGLYCGIESTGYGYFAYAPADGADEAAAFDALLAAGAVRQRWLALGLLVAAGCAAAAVWRLPERRGTALPPRWRPVAVSAGFALLFAYLAVGVWQTGVFRVALGQGRVGAAADVLGAVWLPVAGALVALAAAVLAMRRRAAWPAVAGAFLLAVWAVFAAGNLAHALPLPPPEPNVAAPLLLSKRNATAVSVSAVDLTWIAAAVALVIAPVLVAAGCLYTAPGRSRPEPPASTDPDA